MRVMVRSFGRRYSLRNSAPLAFGILLLGLEINRSKVGGVNVLYNLFNVAQNMSVPFVVEFRNLAG